MLFIICDWRIWLFVYEQSIYYEILHRSIKRYGFLGLNSKILKWWSTSHDAYHHINVISYLCDLDSAFHLHWSALFQAMSAAACFMISGKCPTTYLYDGVRFHFPVPGYFLQIMFCYFCNILANSLLIQSLNITFLQLVSHNGWLSSFFHFFAASVELTREICEQLDGLVGPQLTLLASDICEQFTINRRISGSVENPPLSWFTAHCEDGVLLF